MQCPRCQNVVLDEIDRSGVTIDRCGNCRGIWLDRGELEKLVARATAELEQAPRVRAVPQAAVPHAAVPYPSPHSPYGYDDREPPSSRRGYHHQRRRSFWHELFD